MSERPSSKLGRKRGINDTSAARFVLQALSQCAQMNTVSLHAYAKRFAYVSNGVGYFRRDVLCDNARRGYLLRSACGKLWSISEKGTAEIARILGTKAPPANAAPAAAPSPPAIPMPELLVRGVSRPLSPVDVAPCIARAGSTDALELPSRRGDRRYYRDGRVTDLHGNPIQPPRADPAAPAPSQPGAACA